MIPRRAILAGWISLYWNIASLLDNTVLEWPVWPAIPFHELVIVLFSQSVLAVCWHNLLFMILAFNKFITAGIWFFHNFCIDMMMGK